MTMHEDDRLTEGAMPPGRPAPKRRSARAHVDEREADERGLDERELTEDREMTEDERLEEFLDAQAQAILPDLPKMPGYHVCWLTTSNKSDSIPWRQRIGYELISPSMLGPAWAGSSAKDSSLGDVVMINEMVAARIPLSLYNRMLRAVGHQLPLREEEKLRAHVEQLKDGADRYGAKVIEGDGMARVVQRAGPMPVFEE